MLIYSRKATNKENITYLTPGEIIFVFLQRTTTWPNIQPTLTATVVE
jgi:hypothetical protein